MLVEVSMAALGETMLALIAAVTTFAATAEPPRDEHAPPVLAAKVISCIDQ